MVIRRGCQPLVTKLGCDLVMTPALWQWWRSPGAGRLMEGVLQVWGLAEESAHRCGPWHSSPTEGCAGNALTCELTLSSRETCRLLGGVGGAGVSRGREPLPPLLQEGAF